MSGNIALVGSGEYLPVMDEVDRRLLATTPAQAGGTDSAPRVVCIPAAAGQEGKASVDRWLRMGMEHFTRLGAQVEPLRIIDRASAEDARWVEPISSADLIYLSGGNPLYLYRTLAGSRAWTAVQAARERGAVLAGCSAGAMILARHLPDVRSPELVLHAGFGLVAPMMILPHFDRLESFRPGATAELQQRIHPGEFVLGVDEDTALVGAPGGSWEVMGARAVVVLTRRERKVFHHGEIVPMP
jgi:cyanophycinase